MVANKPIFCRPRAHEAFVSHLPMLGTTDGLVAASVAVSMHELEGVEPRQVQAELADIAADVRSRVRMDSPRAQLAHLHDVLFDQMGFEGNAEDYYDPLNSYLPAVLERRRGLPITLTLVYKAVAERVGHKAQGINAPWHFIASVELEGQIMFVDPFFAGRTLKREEAFERIEQLNGEKVEHDDRLLWRATHRQWMSRILLNLQNVFYAAKRSDDLAAMSELQSLLNRTA